MRPTSPLRRAAAVQGEAPLYRRAPPPRTRLTRSRRTICPKLHVKPRTPLFQQVVQTVFCERNRPGRQNQRDFPFKTLFQNAFQRQPDYERALPRSIGQIVRRRHHGLTRRPLIHQVQRFWKCSLVGGLAPATVQVLHPYYHPQNSVSRHLARRLEAADPACSLTPMMLLNFQGVNVCARGLTKRPLIHRLGCGGNGSGRASEPWNDESAAFKPK